MRPPLPLASYLFILRKHLFLVLGTIAVVLAAGWWYGQRQEPVYRASARVEIRSGTGRTGVEALVLPEDPVFIANQVYDIRNDPALRRRVLDYLRKPPVSVTGPAGDATAETDLPPPHDSALFRDRREIPGTVSVTAIPPTSFYEIAVTGPDRDLNGPVANAYALVFARVFREEQERRYRGAVKDLEASREAKRKHLEGIQDGIAAHKKAHPQVDFREGGTGGPDRDEAVTLRGLLTAERTKLVQLQNELDKVKETLRAARLELREDEERGMVLAPPFEGEDPGADPRLGERVQSLDVVSRHEGVRKAAAAIEELERKDRHLEKSLRETTSDRTELRAWIRDQQKVLARNTEAAVIKLAQDLAYSKAVVDGWSREVQELERKSEAVVDALAEHERMVKVAEASQSEIAALDARILQAEQQRQRAEEEGGTVRVRQYAPPGEAALVAPNRPVVYLTAAVAAILLAAGLAYVLEYLDDTVKSREDFDRLVRLPFLGYVPHVKGDDDAARDLVVARGRTGSPEVESFRSIRTGVQFSRTDREVRTLLVTSAGPGEGKTMISMNLASAFAGGKGRVLLVDADLRRARVHASLGVDNSRGLTNVLVGECALADAVQRSSVEGLDVLASGPIPPNPAEVLGSERMQELLREAASRWDRVVVDSPPLVAVTDPALLAKFVDSVLLVINIGKTSIRTIQRARETLATVGVAIHGAVLNNADVKVSGYYTSYGGYGYGYGYGYGTSPREGEKKAPPPAVPAAKD